MLDIHEPLRCSGTILRKKIMSSEEVAAHINSAEAKLEIEYQRTKTEAVAFQNFRQRVTNIVPLQPRSDGGITVRRSLARRPQSHHSPCERACKAYQETVLSMPHYVVEYDEPLFEHLVAEFGEELATSLSANAQLTPPLKKGLSTASRQAARERGRFSPDSRTNLPNSTLHEPRLWTS